MYFPCFCCCSFPSGILHKADVTLFRIVYIHKVVSFSLNTVSFLSYVQCKHLSKAIYVHCLFHWMLDAVLMLHFSCKKLCKILNLLSEVQVVRWSLDTAIHLLLGCRDRTPHVL